MKKLLKGNVHTFAAVLLVIGAIFSVPAFFLYQNVEKIVLKETNKKAGTVAVSISKFIEQDIDEYEKLSDAVAKNLPGNYNMDYYKKMSELLRDIKKEPEAKFIYTERLISEDKIAYVLDAEDPSSEHYCPLGTEDNMSDLEKKSHL